MSTLIENKQKNLKSLRFGGISPVVLRELSGVYQPFVKAVKELISNAYDADANKVDLYFRDEFRELTIKDDGNGMNPIEFVRDYIRIGKSIQKDEFTSKKRRPRIGGKGIGFLAPARYCNVLEVKTKKKEKSIDILTVELHGNSVIDFSSLLLQGHHEKVLLDYIQIIKVTNCKGEKIDAIIKGFEVNLLNSVEQCHIWYEFDASSLELTARIDFDLLFSIESGRSLEAIENFCEIAIQEVPEKKNESYTEITLYGIKDFVRNELLSKGKKGAKNIESNSGIDKFLWNLSRIIPVKAQLNENLPKELTDFIRTEIDGEDKGYPIEVNVAINNLTPLPLKRFIIKPDKRMDIKDDADIIKILEFKDENGTLLAKGFLIGQSTTIYPAECRGILIRVKGVAIGEPTYFGLDQILTGSAKVALSQISGEINIISGIDAIRDINPGRDGFYKESKIYNLIKKALIGESTEKLSGHLKDVIDAIITRSEVNASITNFIKRYEGHRRAILEASAAIAEVAAEDFEVLNQFFIRKPSYELQLSPAVKYKADGKLASYTVRIVDDIEEAYKIDYVGKELLLNSGADIWKRNINIGGTNFEIVFKHGKQKMLFCEVNPNAKAIYINWDHPMRGTMGDTSFIKHCLATVASALPQEKLNTYIKLITNKI